MIRTRHIKQMLTRGEFTTVDRWWTRRTSIHPGPLGGNTPSFEFATSDDLWAACCEYFEWMETRPQYESRPMMYKGIVNLVNVPLKRPYTLTGLLLFLDLSIYMWGIYKKDRGDVWTEVIEKVEAIIYTQKFEGAAVDLFNANIIARDLGLRDRQEVSGPDGGPITTKELTKVDLATLSDDDLDAIVDAIDRHSSKGGQS